MSKYGKKYVLIGHIGMFGPGIYGSDLIEKLPHTELDNLKKGEAVLFKAENDKIFRILRNGRKIA